MRLRLTCGYHYDGRLETSRQLAAAKLLLHTVEDVFPKHRRAAAAQLYKSSIIAWHRQFKNREPLPGLSPSLNYFGHSRNLVWLLYIKERHRDGVFYKALYVWCLHSFFAFCEEAKMDTFSSAPTSPRTQSMQLVLDDHQFQIMPVANCLTIFGAYMEILFIIVVKILELITWSSGSPPIMLTNYVGPRMVTKFLICCSMSLKRMSFWCLYLDAHTTQI